MITKSFSLCPACSACPAVEIDEHEVRIGEGSDLAKLTPAEWNVLVRAIKGGTLGEIPAADGDPADREDPRG